jgi:hypothetical protein
MTGSELLARTAPALPTVEDTTAPAADQTTTGEVTMNALTWIWMAVAMPGFGVGVSVLQARLERWDHYRHAED